jgi:hypothetical protein
MKNAFFWDKKPNSYLTGNTLSLGYRAQPGFTAVAMKNAVLWDKNPVRTSQKTLRVSATDPSRFFGGDYEECSFLG